MSKLKAMKVLLIVVLAYQPFSAAAQTPQENRAKSRQQVTLSESQTLGPIYITLVKPLPDSPINFSKKAFRQELQHRLALQIRFSLVIQILALVLGFLSLAAISLRRRTRALDQRRLLP